MTMRQAARTILLAIAASLAAACASEEASSVDAPAVLAEPEGAVTAEGSAATKRELGVVRWSAVEDERALRVRGFDGGGAVRVELERAIQSASPSQHVHRWVLAHHGRKSSMQMALADNGDGTGILTLLATSFAGDTEAVAVIEAIQRDFEQSGGPAALTTRSIATSSLRPLAELTNGQCADLVKCGHTKLMRVDADTKAALTCIGAPLTVGGGVAVDLLQGRDPTAGAAARAGDCARAQEHSRNVAAESAAACRIDCVQL